MNRMSIYRAICIFKCIPISTYVVQGSVFHKHFYTQLVGQHIHFPVHPKCYLSTSTYAAGQIPETSTIRKLFKKLGWFDTSLPHLKRSSYLLYEKTVDNVDYSKFFNVFNMENSFNSWFLITELHVWMLLVRVMAEKEEGRFVRNNIVEAMWADVKTRATLLLQDSSSPVARKQIKELNEQFQAALIMYDEGLQSDDKVLAGALWRRFLSQNCDNPEDLESLVSYVRKHIMLLDELPSEKVLIRPDIKWIDFEKIIDKKL